MIQEKYGINSKRLIAMSQRGKNSPRLAAHLKDSDKSYHARSMSWAQRLKRVFNIDITQCEVCEKSNVNIIACITAPDIIAKIVRHVDKQDNAFTHNSSRAAPLKASLSATIIDDYAVQRDFDFGA